MYEAAGSARSIFRIASLIVVMSNSSDAAFTEAWSHSSSITRAFSDFTTFGVVRFRVLRNASSRDFSFFITASCAKPGLGKVELAVGRYRKIPIVVSSRVQLPQRPVSAHDISF